jgi:hypothetical protein
LVMDIVLTNGQGTKKLRALYLCAGSVAHIHTPDSLRARNLTLRL